MQDQTLTGNLGGIDRDTQPELQQDGTYRFALNIREDLDSLAQIENMESNALCAEIPGTIIGSIYLIDKFILFIAGNGTSEIGYFYSDKCKYEKIPLNCNLNFSKEHPISAAYKISNICDDFTIYWTDGLNPVRYLELGRLPDSCEDLNLFSCKSFPLISSVTINDGGGILNCGTYQFAIRYRDKNGSVTSFFSVTNPVPVVDESFNSDEWRYIDGCGPSTFTNKSITLNLQELDSDYDYIDIAIIYYTNGIPQHTVLEAVPALNGDYTITNNGTSSIDILEIIVPFASWQYADMLTVHQNRLLLSTLKPRDDYNYQQYANNIKVKWKTIKLPIEKAYKDPKTSEFKTFIGDEKYALGIVLDYCDGTSSPAFHIPGPTEEEVSCGVFPIKSYLVDAVPGGNATITYVEYNDFWEIVPENDFNNFFECPKYVWEVFNTAGICATPELETVIEEDCGIITNIKPGTWHLGHMAFTQECEVYPDTLDCEGVPIYPHTKNEDGTFTMHNVRHHRFPTRKLEPHFQAALENVTECEDSPNPELLRAWEDHDIFPLGVEVTNIVIPENLKNDVIGYRLVFVKRDATNRSVIGKGILHNNYWGWNFYEDKFYTFPRYCVNSMVTISPLTKNAQVDNASDCPVIKFHSPDTSFDKGRLLNPAYLSYEAQVGGVSRSYGVEFKNVDDEECCSARFNANLIRRNTMYDFVHNSPVEKSTYISAHSILSGTYDTPYYNLYGESGVLFELKVRDGVVPTIPFKPEDNGFCDNGVTNTRSDVSYFKHVEGVDGCGANFDRCTRAYYGALKSYRCNQYESLTKLYYTTLKQEIINKNIAALSYSLTAFGDGYINYWAYKRSGASSGYYAFQDSCFGASDLKLPTYPYNIMINTICESDFNVDFRHSENASDVYYPKLNNGSYALDIVMDNNAGSLNEDTLLTRFHKNMEKNIYINLGDDNSKTYNKDFLKLNDEKIYPGLPINYDPCDCETLYQNSIASSEASYGAADGWKVFKINNIVNIPKYTGKLTNVFTMNNNLFAHTEHNLWQISTSQTRIQAEGANVYLGTGDMFSSTPQYIYASPEGFGGLQQRLGHMLNQLGYWFIDTIGAKLLNLNSSIEVIEKGLIRFLHDNLIFSIKKYIPDYVLSTTGAIGWLIGYDYKNSVVYITKKDYELKDETLFGGDYDENNCEQGHFYNKDGQLIFVLVDPENPGCDYTAADFSDTTYFCNKSWTLSYSLVRKQFKSFHSFIPDFYVYDRYNLYTVKDGGIYKHNIENDYQRYYGTYYPSAIELVTRSKQTVYWDSASYMEEAYLYNEQYKKHVLVNDTFTRGYLFNKDQNTGMMDLIKSTDYDEDYMSLAIKDSSNSVRVFKGNDLWYYNGFSDFVIDNQIPHNTCECLDPVDQLPNNDAIDTGKPYYNISPIRGSYIVQRLYWDDSTKFKVKHRLSLLINSVTNVNR